MNMRKILSVIVILSVGVAFASALTHQETIYSDTPGSIALSETETLEDPVDAYRKYAIAEIINAMKGYTNVAYFNDLVAQELKDINNLSDKDQIKQKMEAAVNKLNLAVPAYTKGITDAVGTLGTPQKGYVIEVTDQNGKVFKFYNPKKATPTEEK